MENFTAGVDEKGIIRAKDNDKVSIELPADIIKKYGLEHKKTIEIQIDKDRIILNKVN